MQMSEKQKVNPWDILEGHRNPAPLSWSWFRALKHERKPMKYEEAFVELKYANTNLVNPASYYLEAPPLPAEDLEPQSKESKEGGAGPDKMANWGNKMVPGGVGVGGIGGGIGGVGVGGPMNPAVAAAGMMSNVGGVPGNMGNPNMMMGMGANPMGIPGVGNMMGGPMNRGPMDLNPNMPPGMDPTGGPMGATWIQGGGPGSGHGMAPGSGGSGGMGGVGGGGGAMGMPMGQGMMNMPQNMGMGLPSGGNQFGGQSFNPAMRSMRAQGIPPSAPMTHQMMGTGGINMPLNPNMGMVEQMRVSRMPGQVGPLRAQIRGMRPTSGMAAQQQPIMHGSGGGGAGGHMYNQGKCRNLIRVSCILHQIC